jgi:nucleoid DNA-binding protein
MGNLTKRDLVVRISNETGMVQQDVLNVIQKMLDSDVPIPPRAVVKFKAGKEMKARVTELSRRLLEQEKSPQPGSNNHPPAA